MKTTSTTARDTRAEGRGSRWTDERIREELQSFLADRTEWPTYREFERNGLKALRDGITKAGGAERWAQEMGVRFVRHPPGYAPIWTEDRIRRDLTAYLAGRSVWPSRQEFERDGLTALRNAVNRSGGPDRWAAEFELPRQNRLSGIRRAWTPEAIAATLREFIGESDMWPTRREFERAGLSGMLTAIYRGDGPDYWARRFKVRRHRGPSPGRRAMWTEEQILQDLEAFCAGHDVWPTEREFVHAGRRDLYSAASRTGGIGYWADQLGLPRRRPRA